MQAEDLRFSSWHLQVGIKKTWNAGKPLSIMEGKMDLKDQRSESASYAYLWMKHHMYFWENSLEIAQEPNPKLHWSDKACAISRIP